ncbi:uncharacterized protein DNG_06777 [Cephalotrichum gorgonifer]|uniref:Uncharacterized protein n=1 Tax=Cephalotrichum gorgonifer TaxID=2041049 RepID=A0AAE8SWX5_9PEZI|nr:uncharacterized protein DNG_06777 [Cephalotrichum gorgonifer]
MGLFYSNEPSTDSTRATTPESPDLIITSPYTEPEHQLDLTTLDTENALLARALQHMQCVREDYATAPYVRSFNWDEVMGKLQELAGEAGGFRETTFFVVAFRSTVPPTTEYADLGVLDKVAHEEAVACGGFLKYWFGTPDGNGRNLATCVWRAREDAVKAGHTPGHKKAMRATAAMYSEWGIDRHRLVVGEGAKRWEFVDWRDEDDERVWGL